MENNITVEKITDEGFCTRTNTKYFVDYGDKNLASFDELSEANRYAMNVAKENGLKFCGHEVNV